MLFYNKFFFNSWSMEHTSFFYMYFSFYYLRILILLLNINIFLNFWRIKHIINVNIFLLTIVSRIVIILLRLINIKLLILILMGYNLILVGLCLYRNLFLISSIASWRILGYWNLFFNNLFITLFFFKSNFFILSWNIGIITISVTWNRFYLIFLINNILLILFMRTYIAHFWRIIK